MSYARLKVKSILYFIPTKLVPYESEILYVVLNLKRAILVKHSQLTAAAWAASHQKYQRILGSVTSRLKEYIEHAATTKHTENKPMSFCLVRNGDSAVL